MGLDSVTPLINWDEFTRGAFRDLARAYTDEAGRRDLLAEATRLCEASAGGRRLAPFTDLTETHRLSGVDPDEYVDSTSLPMDLQGVMGRSYAQALGVTTLVRHCFLNQFATRFPEYWEYSNIKINVSRTYGGGMALTPQQYQGPAADTGHVWFHLGLFIPVGSYADVTYSGGYQTTPADLKRACKQMLAHLVVQELQPGSSTRDPGELKDMADETCAHYQQD